MNTYKVINIFEQDFGCEGLPDGQEYSVNVILENLETKERITITQVDSELYKKNINIKDIVSFDGKTISKADL